MRHWFCVTSPKNFKICIQQQLWGLDDRYRKTLEEYVSIGDPFIFYTTGNSILAGTAVASSDCFENNTSIGWTKGKTNQPEVFPYGSMLVLAEDDYLTCLRLMNIY